MKLKTLAIYFLVSLTFACSEQQSTQKTNSPQAFNEADECHVCGMVITRFAGPKGQAFDKRATRPRKFCSTMDMMYWVLQPENKPNVTEIYVHDMSRSAWDSPNDEHLILARSAFFVIGSDMRGAMGASLASFGDRSSAERFASEHGGKVFAFDEVTLSMLNE